MSGSLIIGFDKAGNFITEFIAGATCNMIASNIDQYMAVLDKFDTAKQLLCMAQVAF